MEEKYWFLRDFAGFLRMQPTVEEQGDVSVYAEIVQRKGLKSEESIRAQAEFEPGGECSS